ncbi:MULTISPECIES: DUF302 domain-containing protein [unclassified Streptomyces]|uniref:DUF302 domain-containing protein n=1 Tax=unclassified Streptomyces TaxID=2593676 RepID=UPI002DD7BA9C|nr:DUF302 domain-containing protein [Streptomyces sp. NBC_01761]WSC55061.1 DUF302 domain-containing protein [Streptomyces sp. NBC_01761]WSF85896.1 DUF302 domain-containing protein [Streptomyces sp. NBC_01744]
MTAEAEADADDGLVTVACNGSVRETIDRLHEAITASGFQVFARIDHADHAARIGLELRPTELLIFGKPEGGTQLMQDRQTAGIDLPSKALAWQDAAGDTWVTCNDASWLAARHGLGPASEAGVAAVEASTVAAVRQATGPATV